MLSTSKKILMFLFLFILTSQFFSQAATEQRVALVIGNSAYKTGPLRNPINDAVAMSDTLKKLGFNVTLIKNAQHQDMDEAIRDFGNQLKRTRGVGLFYYAGHGMQIGGVNYLLPVNARIEKESDVRFHSINTDMLIAEMVNAENGMNIIILDACRDNPFYSYFRNTSRGLAIINNAPSGMFISYSTGANQVARDGEGANSPYTKALLEYIDEPGMTINDVFMKVRRKLKKETGQVPWEMSSLERKFYFVVGEDEEQRRLKEEKALAERKKVLDEQQQKIEKEKAALEAKKSMTLDEEQRRLKEEKALAERKKVLDEQQQKIEKEKAALEQKRSLALATERKLVVVNAVSQKVENRIQFTYDLLGNETEAEVDLIVTVNEKLYKSSDLHLKGDFGTVKMGKHKIVWWDIQKDFPDGVDSSLTWKIEAGRKTFISSALKAKFALIPSGTFTMGVGLDDETMHQVTISQPFYLQTTPVTQRQWKLIMGDNPSKFKVCGDECPVERVSWEEVQEFISKLNTLEKTDKYFLPTEAQWEYAARSGGQNEAIAGMPSEIDRGEFSNYSWHEGNSGGKTHPVGQKLPNGLGLYDMSGNVWEWCQDWYAPYSTGHVTDPVCELPDPGRIINWRILRGGSWYNDFYYCTTTRRYSSRPGGYSSDIGFRLARKH